MNPILVTGGAGYVGSQVCKALKAGGGYAPLCYDNMTLGHDWAVKWGPLEVGDIRDGVRLSEVIRKYKPSAVIHLAGSAYVGESMSDPAKYYENNVAGMLRLLEAMRQEAVDKIIFSSSCAIYGAPGELPIKEDQRPAPLSPYGKSKWMAENMLADCGAAYGIRSVSLRYFNAAGADPDGEVGESHTPETHLIPRVLQAAMGWIPEVEIFGMDYETKDGTCVRDYVHVADLAEAHVRALKHLEDGGPSDVFNLGTGRGFSVREIIDIARQVTGRPIPVRVLDRRPGDPATLVCDGSRAERELGWRPRFTSVESQVRHAWKWIQTLRHSSRY